MSYFITHCIQFFLILDVIIFFLVNASCTYLFLKLSPNNNKFRAQLVTKKNIEIVDFFENC